MKQKIKENVMLNKIWMLCKRVKIWYAFFAMLFSTMLITSRHIINLSVENTTIDSTYVTDFHFIDVIAWILSVIIIYISVKTVTYIFQSFGKIFFQEERKAKSAIWVLIASLLFIMALWFPYLPSYWPGGIYSDTVDSINMALGKAALDNHNPILYTQIWRIMFQVTGAFSGAGEYGGLKLFTVVQTFLLALSLAYFIYRCYKAGIHKVFVFLCLLIFGLFPLYPFYGISLWKDTLFSIAVFIFSIFLYYTFDNLDKDISWKQLFIYCLLSLLIIFLRNNGIYISVFYSVMITLLCMKKKKTAVKIGSASFIIIAISGIICGPVFNHYGYNIDRSTESLGIPLQQTAYIIATDGKMTEEDIEVIENIMPLESWIELYDPITIDTIKFDPGFNREYLESNTSEFMEVYLDLVVKNPVKAVKAYMLTTMGFWDIFEGSSTAYICNFHFGNVEYFMSDYFDYYLDISFRNYVEPKIYISAAIFIWLMIGTIFICLARKNYKGLIPIMPTLGLWLSIMAAVPVAFSFRYVYAVFLCVPLYIILCVRSFK